MRQVVNCTHLLLFVTWILGVIAFEGVARPLPESACDANTLDEARAEFRRLQALRKSDPEAVSEVEFRSASTELVLEAEACYQARFGAIRQGLRFDDGGLWADGAGPNWDYRAAAAPPSPGGPKKYNLFGTKWGPDSPYFSPVGDHYDVAGPRSPGGVVTYSFMPTGVNLSAEGSGTNTAIGALATFESCFYQQITDAFAAWSAIADIQFLPVTDNGVPLNYPGASGDIRIGAHYIDGVDGVVAHAYYPPPNGISIAGDLHFDTSESWACDPRLVTGWEIDIGLVALHEIGHSLGLAHELTDPAIMSLGYNPSLDFGPVADDIIGITEIYGPSPLGAGIFGGDLGIGTDHPSASVHVKRDDGTALVRVEDTGPQAQRKLFELVSKGGPRFELTNTVTSTTWFFGVNAVDQFQFSLLGSGGPEFLIQKDGRVLMGPGASYVFNLSPAGNLTIAGNMTANDYLYSSDRNLKEAVEPVDVSHVLSLVKQLPISTWNFRDDEIRHMGPMAQEFYAAFGLGQDDRHLSPVDTAGVAIAAIQGLQRELEQKEVRIQRLEGELAEIRALLAGAVTSSRLVGVSRPPPHD